MFEIEEVTHMKKGWGANQSSMSYGRPLGDNGGGAISQVKLKPPPVYKVNHFRKPKQANEQNRRKGRKGNQRNSSDDDDLDELMPRK